MRNLFTTLFIILALLVGTAGAAPAVHAAIGDACNADGNPGTLNASGLCVPKAAVAPTVTGGTQTAADVAATKTPTQAGPSADDAYNGVMVKVMSLFAWLLGVAAITLDAAVYYTVVTMGEYVSKLSAVGVAWRILRDLGNIALIFGFLAIGINIILGTNAYGWGRSLLPKLLMAAVALNFSLFITEAIIDGGNLFATQFYTQINGGQPAGAPVNVDSIVNATSGSIASKIMGQLGLATIYGEATQSSKSLFTNGNPWYIGFMGILLFIIAAFVMFSLAFILIARFVALIFIIILAPIGVVGFAVPPLENLGKQWRSQLINQTLTAPILLLMLYVALVVITDVNFLTGFGSKPNWLGFVQDSNGVTNFTGFASVMLSFLVAMGLLLAVTMYAKKMGAWGADMATKLGSKASFGVAAWGGRATFGLAGRGLDSRWVRAQASKSGFGGLIAKGAAFTGRRLENRTYDIRNVKTAQDLLSGSSVGFNTGVVAGSSITAKEAVNKTIEKAKYIKPFTGDWWRDQQKEYEMAKTELDRKNVLDSATTGSVAVQKELKKMSVDELAQLKDIRGGIDKLVYNLSPEKFNELMKSDKLLPGEKKKLSDKWDEQFANTAAAPAIVATTMSRFNTEEIAALGGNTLSKLDVIDTLGANEFEAIRRKGNLTKQQRHDIFDRMTSPTAPPALAAAVADYFLPANDPGRNREKYWDV